MLRVELDEKMLKEIEKACTDMQRNYKQLMKKSLNAAGKEIKKLAIQEDSERYAFKKKKTIKENVKEDKATAGKLEYIIKATNERLEVGDYHVTNRKVLKGDARPKKGIKGKVLKENDTKQLKVNGVLAFVTQFKSGHVAVVVRVPGESYSHPEERESKGWDTTRIEKLLSPSVHKSLKHAFPYKEKEAYKILLEEISKEINKTLGGTQ